MFLVALSPVPFNHQEYCPKSLSSIGEGTHAPSLGFHIPLQLHLINLDFGHVIFCDESNLSSQYISHFNQPCLCTNLDFVPWLVHP